MEYIDKILIGSREKEINRFILAFSIYTLALSLIMRIIPEAVTKVAFIFPSFVVYFWLFIKLASLKNIENLYLRIMVIALFCWTIFVMRNADFFDYEFVSVHFFATPYGLILFSLPFVILLPVCEESFFYYVIYYSKKSLPWFLPICLILFFIEYYWKGSLNELSLSLCISITGFLLLCTYYLDKKVITWAFLLMILVFLCGTYFARRNVMLTSIMFMTSSLLIFLRYNTKISAIMKAVYLSLLGFIMIVGLVWFSTSKDGFFSSITSRATVNSRDVVFGLYFTDMSNEKNNWIYGKGISGTYYAPYIDVSIDNVNQRDAKARKNAEYRGIIECGYLQVILNGGLIYLTIMLAIFLPAVFKGIFCSRNIFSKGCATLIIIWLIDMFPFGLPVFSPRYFFVWFAVALCFSPKIRNLSDEEILAYFSDEIETSKTEGI